MDIQKIHRTNTRQKPRKTNQKKRKEKMIQRPEQLQINILLIIANSPTPLSNNQIIKAIGKKYTEPEIYRELKKIREQNKDIEYYTKKHQTYYKIRK